MKEDSTDKEIFPIKMKLIWLNKKKKKIPTKQISVASRINKKGKWKEKLCKFQIKQNKVK